MRRTSGGQKIGSASYRFYGRSVQADRGGMADGFYSDLSAERFTYIDTCFSAVFLPLNSPQYLSFYTRCRELLWLHP